VPFKKATVPCRCRRNPRLTDTNQRAQGISKKLSSTARAVNRGSNPDLCLRGGQRAPTARTRLANTSLWAPIRSEIAALFLEHRMVEVQITLVASPRNQFPHVINCLHRLPAELLDPAASVVRCGRGLRRHI
jgi:hypothetical protein